jgi:uncharacterized membrane protein
MGRVIEIRHSQARGAIAPPRVDFLDLARGAALVAMIVYHLAWDLGFFGLIDPAVAVSPPMRGASHAIASAFLFIAGVSTALTHRGKFNGRKFRSQFVKVALGAAAVTIVTSFVTPQTPVTFGVLHAIALGLLVSAPLAKAPWPLTAALGLTVVLAPQFIRSPALDGPLWSWIGLGVSEPATLDWRPFCPWVGAMLLGLAFARSPFGQRALVRAGQEPEPRDAPSQALIWMGRRSLWIYLAHQPILFAAVWLAARLLGAAAGAPAADDERGFLDDCVAACRGAQTATICETACGCVVDKLRQTGVWADASRGLETSKPAIEAASRACVGAR